MESAINISVDTSLEAISGKVAILADCGPSMQRSMSGGKNYGSIHDCAAAAKLLSILIRRKCSPESELFLYSCPIKVET